MRAIQIQSHGGLEVLEVATLPDPKPVDSEVLVRVRASAVNPLDGIVRMGEFPIGPLAEQVRALTEGKGADVVLDTVGGQLTGRALSSLGSFGRLVHLGYSAGTTLTIDSLDLISKPCTILGFNILLVPAARSAADLDAVMALAARGKYRAMVDRTFHMADVAEATRYLDERRAVGKVVLTL